jgi:hypothetical protein
LPVAARSVFGVLAAPVPPPEPHAASVARQAAAATMAVSLVHGLRQPVDMNSRISPFRKI